ncbi:MAG: xanthine dehydrogenase family protein molybdopterin-binding subunit [Spirochaetales bacterium]|nr:xanthine dehydrogenase family protein molybdopterin-binding subunit [Spirochaetales bacterium]
MSIKTILSHKLKGEAIFTDDIAPDNMIYGYTVRSEIPRGTILSIKIPELPGGYICADYKDIPGQKFFSTFGEEIPYLAEKKVHYIGEPILLLCGPDKQKLQCLGEQVSIEYKAETPVFSPLHAPEENIFDIVTYSKGSFSGLKDNPCVSVKDTYTTGSQEHLSLEPLCAVSLWNEKSIIIYASTLYPYHIKDNVALFLGVSKKRVKVIVPDVCAPFGGKLFLPTMIAAHTSLLSYMSLKPVKILYTREEDITCSFKRHPAVMTHEIVTDEEGNLLGIYADIIFDAGAYNVMSRRIIEKAVFSAFGMYYCDHMELKARLVKTNKIPSGYFSGSGEIQSLFALECNTYKIAQKVKTDPYIWKKKNISLDCEKRSPPNPGKYSSCIAVIDEVVRISDFLRKYGAYEAIKKPGECGTVSGATPRGIGLVLCPHIIGDFYETETNTYTLTLRLGKNRKLKIMTSLIDMGTSKAAYFAMIASHILNIHISEVIIEKTDTDNVPDTGPTIGSRAAYNIGKCIEQACESIKCKEKKKGYPIEVTKKINLPVKNKKNAKKIPFTPPVITWEGTVVEVEVDPVTFITTCRGIWIVLDPGPVVNDEIARQHVEAAALQNFGFATMEVLEFKNGKVYQNDISEYTIPDITTVPDIHVRFIQNRAGIKHYPGRGLGDQAVTGVAPGYISALYQATNNSYTHLPCTPESIMELMQNR